MQNRRYPKLFIRSKNELAKHLSYSKFSKTEALSLINEVMINFDKYWQDNTYQSQPEKEKYVRSAKRTPLGRLLDNINKKILAPHDKLLPDFIFGGVKGLNHSKAVEHLLGQKRRRILLKMDISRFFEQISEDRVYYFFKNKCECNEKVAKLLAKFCCVSIGPKGNNNEHKTIARGFATSSRLAVWCNLDIFIKLEHLIKKRLRGKDPRITIYVDDIGITASGTTKEYMEKLYIEIEKLFLNSDKNQSLPLNNKKKSIKSHEEGMEILGLRMFRNRLEIGAKTKSKMNKIKNRLSNNLSEKEKVQEKNRLRSILKYKKYVEK